ncbi:MAG: hypothetical protein OEV40_18585 [Acidimicrobiia bacterium]|nr:hypothetical protein [Acidimicrobiia bacterium]
MELPLFEQTGELARALVAADLGELRFRAHRRGVKVWFGPAKPSRFHFEAQLIPNHLAPDGAGSDDVTIEVGFHAEHGDERRNEAVLERLRAAEKTWRRALGEHAVAGPFLGNDHWCRLSETWTEADTDDPDLAFELASRLADYIQALQPLLEE